MMQAFNRDGRVLRFALTGLRQDFKVVVQAVANHKETLAFCTGGIHPATFHVMVQEKMQLQQSFLNDFLRGIAISPNNVAAAVPRHVGSYLPKLDLGDETSQAFKQLIAEYLGVPVGMELTLLRKCWTNLNSTSTTAASASSTTATTTTIRERIVAREQQHQQRDPHHPRLDWLAHGPHPPPNNNNNNNPGQPQAERVHPHPAWNNLQRLAHYRNRRMQRLHVMGGRGRVVFLHGNGGNPNPNNNNNPPNNNNNNQNRAHPFDVVVEQHRDPQPRPGFPIAHPHRLWNFLEDDHLLDERHDLDDIDDDDEDLEMEFML